MAAMNQRSALTPQSKDFPRWYQDLLERAELADNGPVRGTMVIRPYAYALWERMQGEVDRRIRATGAENVYLPSLIPRSYLERETDHIDGFSPELAVVTHAGGKRLAEPVVVRPTSETLFGHVMSRWIQSHRDLPMLLNQWANVVRWEMRPRIFLRTSEFLWQEGHTAHATREDAAQYARRIHLDVYRDFLQGELAIPVLVGVKTRRERFAGAVSTMTCEAMMGDGKALQMATTHELGQKFARAFGITFTDSTGLVRSCWTTSWGSSTRMIGGVIMAHGDDNGMTMPPRIAPVQAVIIAIEGGERTITIASQLAEDLGTVGVRARVDARTNLSVGRRITEWELKGVPLRVALGPRDIDAKETTIVRRDTQESTAIPVDTVVAEIPTLLQTMQAELISTARKRLSDRTTDTEFVKVALEAAETGFARIPWKVLGEDGEAELNTHAVSVRCLQTQEGRIPTDSTSRDDLIAIVGRSY
jgi:prolyl-tRNA synthetase